MFGGYGLQGGCVGTCNIMAVPDSLHSMGFMICLKLLDIGLVIVRNCMDIIQFYQLVSKTIYCCDDIQKSMAAIRASNLQANILVYVKIY